MLVDYAELQRAPSRAIGSLKDTSAKSCGVAGKKVGREREREREMTRIAINWIESGIRVEAQRMNCVFQRLLFRITG